MVLSTCVVKTYRKVVLICGDTFERDVHWFLRKWGQHDDRFKEVSNSSRSGAVVLQGTSKNNSRFEKDSST
jgi:hypothetical protein